MFYFFLFYVFFSFSQEKINVTINLFDKNPVVLHSGSHLFAKTIKIANDTVMYIDVAKNNIFYIQKGQKKHYVFISKDSHIEYSLLENDNYRLMGEYADFSYFLNDYYNLYRTRINQLLLLDISSDAFEIELYKLLREDLSEFCQNYKHYDLLTTTSKQYFNDLIKYEYFNALSIYLMNQIQDSTQVIPFYTDISLNLLDWNNLQNHMHDVSFFEFDLFQNYIFNALILFAIYDYKYLDNENFQLFNNYLFSFVLEHLPENLLFYFFQTYIEKYSNFLSVKDKKYLQNLLKSTNLTKPEVNILLASSNFLEKKEFRVEKNDMIESDFYLEDLNGHMVSLNDFKGSLVYLDIWASWCGPCRKQFPYAKKLKQNLSKRQLKKIKFVYISIDTDYEKWKESLDKLNLDGYQFISPSNKVNSASSYFSISSIPRYILIDQNGTIIDNNAKRPSDETLLDELLNLIKSK